MHALHYTIVKLRNTRVVYNNTTPTVRYFYLFVYVIVPTILLLQQSTITRSSNAFRFSSDILLFRYTISIRSSPHHTYSILVDV